MSTFVLLAALMALVAALAVAVPLLRHPGSRVLGAVAGVCIIALAAILYPRWSNFDWDAPRAQRPAAASPEVLAMVARLEERLRSQPNDLQGWLMLGRSELALQRMAAAVQAYEHARTLDPNSVEATLGLGEALSMRAGGQISPEVASLFERALTLAPQNPEALLYGGFAAAARGDGAAARSRWEALKKLNPPPQIVAILDEKIAALGLPADTPQGTPPATAATSAPAGAAGATAGTGTPADATVKIELAPALKSRLTGEAPLFVFAREPGAGGPPLAVKRLTSAAIGSEVRLSAADSMIPGRGLTAGERVAITARVSFSGQPRPAPGDLYGELTYQVGHDGIGRLVIDRVAE